MPITRSGTRDADVLVDYRDHQEGEVACRTSLFFVRCLLLYDLALPQALSVSDTCCRSRVLKANYRMWR